MLTDDEWEELVEASVAETLGEVDPPRGGELELTVESILTARLAALTTERDEAKRSALYAMRQRDEERRMKEGNIRALDKAVADLAAANARLSNLGEAHKITKRLAEISDERLDELYEAEAAALRDRIEALMDSTRTGRVAGFAAVLSCDLRAALEGDQQ